jgi:ubiquinone/menaquinone biosynthesis C-methylase UbiE
LADQTPCEFDPGARHRSRDRGLLRPAGRVTQVVELAGSLAPARTLDVACGTGFLTRHPAGIRVGIDPSPSMVAIAQSRLPQGLAIAGDALHLVVADHAFDRVFAGHFYGHLPPRERQAFLAEARRAAGELGGTTLLDGAWFVAARVSW